MKSKWNQLPIEKKLKLSIIFGWSVIILFLGIIPLYDSVTGASMESSYRGGLFMVALILSIRYSVIMPSLKAAAGGATAVGITSILENIFSRRNDGSATIGAFVGAMLIIMFIFIKNAIIAFYYLVKETYHYFKYYRSSKVASKQPVSQEE